MPWVRLPLYVAAQLLASLGAGAVAAALFPGDMAGTATTLAAGVGVGQGLVAEAFFTAYLVFVILMLAGEKSRATALAPVGIGLALFVTQLPGTFFFFFFGHTPSSPLPHSCRDTLSERESAGGNNKNK